MNKIVLVAVLTLAAATVSCGGASSNAPAATGGGGAAAATTRQTRIHFTKNLNKGSSAGQYPAECIGIVSTETLGSKKGDKIIWKVKNTNDESDDDKCTGLVNTLVELRFQTDVMGAAANKKLTANAGGVIQGDVSTSAGDIGVDPNGNPKIVHKYSVWYDGKAAGPDPEIDVDCGGCGEPPGGGK